MAYQVLFRELAFQKTKEGEPTIPEGPEEVVQRGGLVPDYVPTWFIAALFNAGMIVEVADQPRVDLRPVGDVPEQPRTPEQPAVLPSNPNSPPIMVETGQSQENGDPAATLPAPDSTGAEPLPALPKPADNKEAWENYAQRPQIGMSQGDAEAMNKTDLMAEVKRRYEAAKA